MAVSKPPDGVSLPVSRRGAAVTLLKHVKNPILLAKELYLDQDKCPHPFVSGADAERIAEEKGMELVDEKYFYTEYVVVKMIGQVLKKAFAAGGGKSIEEGSDCQMKL